MLRVVLILCFVGGSFQGGVKPQQSGAASPVYQPEYVRGAGSQQPGAPGPLGAKAGGKYPQFPSQGFHQGPAGLQNGYGGLGQKSGKMGLGQFPQPAKQKPGYGNGNYPGNVLAQGIGAKPSKTGYGAGGYPNVGGYGVKPPRPAYGAGNYPQLGAQPAYGAGNYPQNGEQAGYGNGAGLYPGNPQQQGYEAKPPKAGYGAGSYPNAAQGGYGNGAGLYPGNKQQQGYGNGAGLYPGNPQQQGYGNGAGLYPGNPQQQGYGNGAGLYPGNPQQQGYRNGYGGYPNNFQQRGKSGKPRKTGYGNGARFFPSAAGLQGGIGKPSKAAAGYPNNFFPQGQGAKPVKAGLNQQPYPNGLSNFQGNGKGIKSPLSAYQGPAGESTKLGGFGKLPYRSQPLPADSLGYDTKSGPKSSPYGSQAAYPDPANSKYAGAAQVPFSSQPETQGAVEEDVTPSSPVDDPSGTQSLRIGVTTPLIPPTSPSTPKQKPHQGGYQQLGGGPWTYAPEESSYGQTGYYGNGYRGCSGKC